MTVNTTADRVHIEGNVVTTRDIVANMRTFGPNSRVLLVAKDNKTLNDPENSPIEGKNGLLTLYPEDFTGVRVNQQLTHKDGGVIHITTVDKLAGAVMKGIRYSMIVLENCDINANPMVFNDLRGLLTLPPRLWVESKDGEHGEMLWLTL